MNLGFDIAISSKFVRLSVSHFASMKLSAIPMSPLTIASVITSKLFIFMLVSKLLYGFPKLNDSPSGNVMDILPFSICDSQDKNFFARKLWTIFLIVLGTDLPVIKNSEIGKSKIQQ